MDINFIQIIYKKNLVFPEIRSDSKKKTKWTQYISERIEIQLVSSFIIANSEELTPIIFFLLGNNFKSLKHVNKSNNLTSL